MRGFGDQPIGRESSSWPRHRRRASVSASGNSASQFVSVRSRSGAIRRLQSTLPPIPLSRQRCRRGGWAVGGACVCLRATVGRVRELITDAATHKHAPADVLDKRANQLATHWRRRSLQLTVRRPPTIQIGLDVCQHRR